MSVGNLKDNGNKGNNFPYQLKSLQLLACIAEGITDPCCPTAATEATLLQVLGALNQGQAFQQALVTDTGGASCPNCPTYLEVRVWNGVGFDPPIYYDAAGGVVVPIGPVEYINPQYVLESILLQETSINAALNTTRTPNMLRAVGAGTIVPACISASIYNSGTTNATVMGAILKPGETVNFDAGGNNNVLGASTITYVGSATAELLIIYVI